MNVTVFRAIIIRTSDRQWIGTAEARSNDLKAYCKKVIYRAPQLNVLSHCARRRALTRAVRERGFS